MRKIYEMILKEYFILSTGETALVGAITPNETDRVPSCTADLLVNDKYIKRINIIGEDIFSGDPKKIRKDVRSVRSSDNLKNILSSLDKEDVKIIMFVADE